MPQINFAPNLLMPVPYAKIKEIVREYFHLMNKLSTVFKQNPALGVKFDITDEPIGFYISPSELKAILKFQDSPDFSKYLCLLCIEPGKDYLSIAILGADSQGEILNEHKMADITSPFAPQETWPIKTVVRLSDTIDDVNKFLD